MNAMIKYTDLGKDLGTKRTQTSDSREEIRYFSVFGRKMPKFNR